MYDKGILASCTGASLGVVAVVGMLMLSTGTAYAVPIAAVGGFMITADGIEGDDLILYPGMSDAEQASTYPVAWVELSSVEIENLRLTKDIDLDDYGLTGNARLVITGGTPTENVTADAVYLRTPSLSAKSARFSGLTIDEVPPGAPPDSFYKQAFVLEAPNEPVQVPRQINLHGGSNPGMMLDRPKIRSVFLATNQITIPSLGLEMQYDPDNDNVYEFA